MQQQALQTKVAPMVIAPEVAVASQFPVPVSPEQQAVVAQRLQQFDIVTIPLRDIATLESAAELGLHRTLDGFLSRVNQFENPRLFKLVTELSDAVDKEQLPALADKILNGKPGLWDQFKGMFSKKSLAKAAEKIWSETSRLVSGKTKTLVDVIAKMEVDLKVEQQKLDAEISSMEKLKEAYRERYSDFVVTVAFMQRFLEESRARVASLEAAADPNDPVQKEEIEELRSKLESLESRALALEGVLSRLPADQLVIRQLQKAGIQTLQETTTTAAGRFASIKMTLLTINSTMVTKGVQMLANQGAALDANLASVRKQLMHEVVSSAANAPGDNRIAQANQLRSIVDEVKQLNEVVEQAHTSNQQKFVQAKQMFATARTDMLALGQHIRPDKPLQY